MFDNLSISLTGNASTYFCWFLCGIDTWAAKCRDLRLTKRKHYFCWSGTGQYVQVPSVRPEFSHVFLMFLQNLSSEQLLHHLSVSV